jgi:hypothetical protein
MDSKNTAQLQQQRDHILDQMRALDQMRRGSLSRQFFDSPKSEASATQGPYFVLQGYLQGRKFSKRIAAEKAAEVETQVANYKRFQELADQFVTVTEQITLQAVPDSKKNSTRKSKPSVSRKPPPLSG